MGKVWETARSTLRNMRRTRSGHSSGGSTTAPRSRGWWRRSSGRKATRSTDILAGTGALGSDKPRLCVEVESQDTPVGLDAWKKLRRAMADFGVEQGLLVSWGGFESAVRDQARRKVFDIRLWERNDIIDALFKHYETLPRDVRAEIPLKRIWALMPGESEA